MTEETPKRVTREQIKEQVESIKQATATIREALNQMIGCSAKDSFLLTLEALEKKVEKYSSEKQRVKLSDEEKEILKKFREGKIEIIEKPSVESEKNQVPPNEGFSDDNQNTEQGKRKKGKHN